MKAVRRKNLITMEPAKALAIALDDEDYLSARKLLADACVYRIRGALIEGGDAIIASYQMNGEKGRNRFDEVAYESLVSLIGPNKARIDYTDIITTDGDRLVHRCAQEVTWDPSGLVTQIFHIDLPGEVETLEEFKRAHQQNSLDQGPIQVADDALRIHARSQR